LEERQWQEKKDLLAVVVKAMLAEDVLPECGTDLVSLQHKESGADEESLNPRGN
jgi:hypothetical protein